MRIGILFILVFVMTGVSASSVTCTIIEDKVLVDISLSDGDDVILPEEYSLLERDGDDVSFISRDWIRKDGGWILVLPRVVDSAYNLKIVLPSGYVLSSIGDASNELVYPSGYSIGSDGKSIILKWNDVYEEVIVFYEGAENSYYLFWVGIFCLIVVGFLFWKIKEKRFSKELERLKRESQDKKKVEKRVNVSRNLFGEEKRIVELLMERKSCWMKELVRELGISKVMVSRKVRSLIEKGIVVKEKFGREAKISLLATDRK